MESRSYKETHPKDGRPQETHDPSSEGMLHEMEMRADTQHKQQKLIIIVYALLVVFGVATGYILSKKGASSTSNASAIVSGGKSVGSNDTQTFKDSAAGVIEKGGILGEGSHKLIREGGPSQTAALVSSVVDLDQYIGKKVKVWGQTYAAKKTAWFMDVGKIELQE